MLPANVKNLKINHHTTENFFQKSYEKQNGFASCRQAIFICPSKITKLSFYLNFSLKRVKILTFKLNISFINDDFEEKNRGKTEKTIQIQPQEDF